MKLNSKYIDSVTNSLISNKDYNNTMLIIDYIDIETYDVNRRKNSKDGTDGFETRAHIPIDIRKRNNGFLRYTKQQHVDFIVEYLKMFIPLNNNEKVWIDIVSILQDSSFNEIHKERLYGVLIDNKNYKEKILEVKNVLNAFCKNSSSYKKQKKF